MINRLRSLLTGKTRINVTPTEDGICLTIGTCSHYVSPATLYKLGFAPETRAWGKHGLVTIATPETATAWARISA